MDDETPLYFDAPPPEAHRELPDLLAWLGRPALFRLRGADSSRARLISGGLHGNEPSGFRAIHALLRDPPELPVDALLLLGNVRAALRPPGFSYRYLPDEEDMNRVWLEPHGTPQRRLAGNVLARLRDFPLEAFADLHNNTGHNPIYAVVLIEERASLGIARAWTDTFVHYSGMRLGSLLEAIGLEAPGVVIECGQAGQPAADAAGIAGALRFLQAADPFAPVLAQPDGDPHVYRSVGRIRVPEDVRIVFADGDAGDADLTVPPGIDRYNFTDLPAGVTIARRESERGRLAVYDNAGGEVTERYLEHGTDAIRTRRLVVPVMMTTNAEIAKTDCLFYVAEHSSESQIGQLSD